MMPVVNIDNGEFYHISTYDEILFFDIQKELDFFYTFMGAYRCPKNKAEYHAILQPFGFEFVDASRLARVDKITRYDPIRRIAHFDSPGLPTQSCYVSLNRAKYLQL